MAKGEFINFAKNKASEMTKRYFIRLAYNGANYCGWQIQPNALSVQEVLENALSTLLKQEIMIVGAGRTDAGVHAKEMIAHFDFSNIEDSEQLTHKLNSFLPKDITIYGIEEVKIDTHARFDAINRTYKYYVTTDKDPFLHPFKYRIFFPIDIKLMNEACKILFNHIDFTSFSKLHTDVKTNNCKIMQAYWEENNENYIFTIQADRFLRNMVRAIVGTLLDVGKKKISLDEFEKIILSKDRGKASSSAPAHALFLEKVSYESNIYI